MLAKNQIRAGTAVFMAWATLLLASVPPRVGVQLEFGNITREDYLGDDIPGQLDFPEEIGRLTDLRITLTTGTILVTVVAAITLVHWLRDERRVWTLLAGLLVVLAADVGATVTVLVVGSPGLLALELVVVLVGLVVAAVGAFSPPRPRRTPASPGRTAPA